jgi:hypothetical protein
MTHCHFSIYILYFLDLVRVWYELKFFSIIKRVKNNGEKNLFLSLVMACEGSAPDMVLIFVSQGRADLLVVLGLHHH